jgi:hypothetical protein
MHGGSLETVLKLCIDIVAAKHSWQEYRDNPNPHVCKQTRISSTQWGGFLSYIFWGRLYLFYYLEVGGSVSPS